MSVSAIIQPLRFPCTYLHKGKGSNTRGMFLRIPICNLQWCLARSIFFSLEARPFLLWNFVNVLSPHVVHHILQTVLLSHSPNTDVLVILRHRYFVSWHIHYLYRSYRYILVYFLSLPLSFLAFSFDKTSIVLATDNFASGSKTLDNFSKTAYVSFVRDTFLYFVMSVIFFPLLFPFSGRSTRARYNLPELSP